MMEMGRKFILLTVIQLLGIKQVGFIIKNILIAIAVSVFHTLIVNA